MPLLEMSDRGIYCPKAGLYIDPWKKVEKAIITHAHADHARPGMVNYLCTDEAKPVLQYRMGQAAKITSMAYRKPIIENGVKFSFHPAGHVLGSAQIRVEHKGEVWVVSGDYKCESDQISAPFEPVKCHTFITESTFGLPIYRWKSQVEVMGEINAWWERNAKRGITSVLYCYALGKAQRILKNIDPAIGKIYCHVSIENLNSIMREQGILLPQTILADKYISRADTRGALLLTPPAVAESSWLRKFSPCETASASGWMSLRGARRKGAHDKGFVLSDHADWPGLISAVKATEAEQVLVTHGYSEQFARWLNEQGIKSDVLKSNFEQVIAEESKTEA